MGSFLGFNASFIEEKFRENFCKSIVHPKQNLYFCVPKKLNQTKTNPT